MLFTDDEKNLLIDTVSVQDAWVVIQLMDKAAQRGILETNEFAILGELRTAMTDGIKEATGKDYDQALAEVRQRLQAEREAAAAQAAQAEAEAVSEAPVEEVPAPAKKPRAKRRAKAAS